MAEAKAQRVRRVLVEVVASYEPTVVTKLALRDSDEFKKFIAKVIDTDALNELDFNELVLELEHKLDLVIPDRQYDTWRSLFDQIVLLLD